VEALNLLAAESSSAVMAVDAVLWNCRCHLCSWRCGKFPVMSFARLRRPATTVRAGMRSVQGPIAKLWPSEKNSRVSL